MPFPLAHPAAVLPLRRYCPRWLCLPALVLGSIIPDLAYLSPRGDLSDLSHALFAGTGFGIFAGLVLLGIFSMIVPFALRCLPEIYRDDLRRRVQLPARALPSVVLSLAIGTWTHLLLDSLTHSHGWLAMHWNLLRMPVLLVHGGTVKVCHVLWYLSSFVGLVWLVWVIR